MDLHGGSAPSVIFITGGSLQRTEQRESVICSSSPFYSLSEMKRPAGGGPFSTANTSMAGSSIYILFFGNLFPLCFVLFGGFSTSLPLDKKFSQAKSRHSDVPANQPASARARRRRMWSKRLFWSILLGDAPHGQFGGPTEASARELVGPRLISVAPTGLACRCCNFPRIASSPSAVTPSGANIHRSLRELFPLRGFGSGSSHADAEGPCSLRNRVQLSPDCALAFGWDSVPG